MITGESIRVIKREEFRIMNEEMTSNYFAD